MGKVEELVDLINTTHVEWKKLGKRKLSDVSGYTVSTCYRALQQVLEPVKITTNEPKNQSKRSSSNRSTRRGNPKTSNFEEEDLTFIDDPDELLLSTSIRELNKPNPDPRWATILLAAKKQNIKLQGDDDQLARLSIPSLVKQLKDKLPSDVREETFQAFETSRNPSI